VLTSIAELAVRVVLHDPHPRLGGQLGDGGPARRGQGPAGRVGEVGHEVEQRRPLPVHHLGEGGGIEPVLVAGDRHDPGVGELEALERGQVGGLLDGDHRTGVEQRGGGEGDGLLRTGRDDQLLRHRRQPTIAQAGRHQGTKRRIALGRGVLEVASP
jgi:hypothetical protein